MAYETMRERTCVRKDSIACSSSSCCAITPTIKPMMKPSTSVPTRIKKSVYNVSSIVYGYMLAIHTTSRTWSEYESERSHARAER